MHFKEIISDINKHFEEAQSFTTIEAQNTSKLQDFDVKFVSIQRNLGKNFSPCFPRWIVLPKFQENIIFFKIARVKLS